MKRRRSTGKQSGSQTHNDDVKGVEDASIPTKKSRGDDNIDESESDLVADEVMGEVSSQLQQGEGGCGTHTKMRSHLHVGDEAPLFEVEGVLADGSFSSISLAQFRGKEKSKNKQKKKKKDQSIS